MTRGLFPPIISLGLGLALLFSGCAAKQPAPTLITVSTTSPATSSAPAISSSSPAATATYANLAVTVKHNIVYNIVDNVSLQMDLYFPKSMNTAAPAVLYVHGGAWTSGDKAAGAGSGDVAALNDAGFIVVPVNYRMAPRFQFPTMIEDVKCAARFLRAHAPEYGINPDKMGAYGGSAGGHLVSLLGLADESAGWDTGPYLSYSSRVQAVIDLFGPADLPALFAGGQTGIAQSVFGTSDLKSAVLVTASPVNWISKDDPPFLILQGDKDTTVPLSQSQEFYERLTAGGVAATLVVVKNGTHGLNSVTNMQPTRPQLTQMMVEFFQKILK